MTYSGNVSSDCVETIQGDDLILKQLHELCALRSPVYFEFGEATPRSYISRFQKIHDSGSLLVDPLMPPAGNEILEGAPYVKAFCTLNGRRYEFETSLVGFINDEPPALMLARPSELVRIQMRQYTRISFSENSSLRAKIIRGAQSTEPGHGTVVQLGAGGMGVVVDSPEGWEAGTDIEKLMFALPDGYTVYTAATVRSLFPRYGVDGSISGYRCNLQFVNLEQRYSSTLEAFIFKKQLHFSNHGD